MQLLRYIACREPFRGQTQYLAFTVVERVVAGPRFERELRVDCAAAAMHAAHGFGELFGRCILEQIPAYAGIERAAQESRTRERREDDHLAIDTAFANALCELE